MAETPIGPPTIGMEVLNPLTTREHGILRTHLTSGWYKQAAVYESATESEHWSETSAALDDLTRHFYVALAREYPEPDAEAEAGS